MPTEPKRTLSARKLAAIMFLDMVGYTRLMQENEAEAVAKRDRHREVLRREVAEHGGEILQYWGDGTLCLFDSAVEAVHCAADIQRAMREPPEIPLRIGIHLGDVAQDEEGLYGDGVNIAARIESLSVPGAVLVSKKVRDEVRNQADFSCRPMGAFSLKNVIDPVEIYAVEAEGLVTPGAKDLQGKGERVKSPFWKPKTRKQWVFASLLALVLLWGLASGANWLLNRGAPNPDVLPSEIRKERLAILPMENLTGNGELDFLSEYLQDAFAIGFGTINGPELVSPEMVARYRAYADASTNDPAEGSTFYEATGARYLLDGKYYQEGPDSLLFNMFLTDAISGEIVKSFPETTVSSRNKKALAGKLSTHILGFWMIYKTRITDFIPDLNEDMATYEAVQAFDRGMEFYLLDNEKALRNFKQAIELDSTFGMPWAYMGDIYFNRPASKAELDAFIENYGWGGPMGFIHKKIFTAQFERNARQAMSYLGWFRKLAPDEPALAHHHMFMAMAANLPGKAIEIIEKFKPGRENQIHLLPFDYNRLGWLAYAYNLTGQEEKTLDLVDQYNLTTGRAGILQGNIVRAMVRKGETARLDNYIKETGPLELNLGQAPFLLHLQAAWESALIGKEEDIIKYAGQALYELEQLPVEKREWFPPYCHLLLGNLAEAEQGFMELERSNPSEFRYQAMLGIVYTRMVEQNKAQRYLQQLKNSEGDDWGFKQYWLATLQAQLGQKEAAMESLKIAVDKGARFIGEGFPYFFWNMFQNDVFLKPLFDNDSFQELVEPQG